MPVTRNSEDYYNSAVLVKPDGRLTAKYDKRYLLTFFEKPFLIRGFPILDALNRVGRSKKLIEGTGRTVLPTQQGPAGVGICNEWLLPVAIRENVKAGAGFMLNLSNNLYFDLAFLPEIHFGITRIRAIENRRDIAINANYGYSGKIAASGKIYKKHKSKEPSCIVVELQQRQNQTLYTRWGDWFSSVEYRAGWLAFWIFGF